MSANIKIPRGELDACAMGQKGADWIDNTSARTGDWVCVIALVDAVFTTLTPDDNTPYKVNGTVGNLNGKALPKGVAIFGRFTAITLTSGTVVAYNS